MYSLIITVRILMQVWFSFIHLHWCTLGQPVSLSRTLDSACGSINDITFTEVLGSSLKITVCFLFEFHSINYHNKAWNCQKTTLFMHFVGMKVLQILQKWSHANHSCCSCVRHYGPASIQHNVYERLFTYSWTFWWVCGGTQLACCSPIELEESDPCLETKGAGQRGSIH